MTTTKKTQKKKSVKKLKYSNKKLNFVHIATLAGIILILLVIVLAARLRKDQPQNSGGVVEGYIKAAAAGKNKKMQSCYSADKLSDEAKTEISSTIKYFQAHGVKDVNIDSCGSISENKNYSYVYIRYNLVLENEQEYPCISTYLVKVQDKSIICMRLLRFQIRSASRLLRIIRNL